ncbi:hypothetical protein BC834DRAFT_333502 [Gloeopeniophorella convolvens]|nr:hypothetical protein BC834DRAFT_333502 [Gloeopeniophorella convolvens]
MRRQTRGSSRKNDRAGTTSSHTTSGAGTLAAPPTSQRVAPGERGNNEAVFPRDWGRLITIIQTFLRLAHTTRLEAAVGRSSDVLSRLNGQRHKCIPQSPRKPASEVTRPYARWCRTIAAPTSTHPCTRCNTTTGTLQHLGGRASSTQRPEVSIPSVLEHIKRICTRRQRGQQQETRARRDNTFRPR